MVDEVGLEPTMPKRKIYSLLGLPIFLHIHNLVSVAGIEPTLQRPKRRVIPFHHTEKTGAGCENRTRAISLEG